MLFKLLPKITSVREEQSLNAWLPTLSTVFGIITFFIIEFPRKTLSAIVVIFMSEPSTNVGFSILYS